MGLISTNKTQPKGAAPPAASHQPHDEKGNWIPPSTNKIQPRAALPMKPGAKRIYMDSHTAVTTTALSMPAAKVTAPAARPWRKREPGKSFTQRAKKNPRIKAMLERQAKARARRQKALEAKAPK
jgi:hypothetical protein